MWCERRGLFATCSVDGQHEAELTREETEAAVRAHALGNGAPFTAARSGLSGGASASGAAASEAAGDERSMEAAGEAMDDAVASAELLPPASRSLPWALAWEFERLRQRDAWQPSEAAVQTIRAE